MPLRLTFFTVALPTHSWREVWLAALTRPSAATYRTLAQWSGATAGRAFAWVFAGGMIGGTISALAPFATELSERSTLDTLLLALIPVSSLVAMLYVAAFAGCAQGIARLFRGSGTYQQLSYLFAAFSAPLLIIANVLALLPQTSVFLVALYLYWLGLYVVAVRAVSSLSLARSIGVVLAALLTLGGAGLGIALLIGYWGVLLP